MLLCILLGAFMIRSCIGKTNTSSEAKQAISDVRKIIDKKHGLNIRGIIEYDWWWHRETDKFKN